MGTHPDLLLRPCQGPDEYPRLVAVWRSAVDATHDFLAPEHRDVIEASLATEYFPQVELTVAELDGRTVGFAGVSHDDAAQGGLEMLFVEEDHRGRGIGRALVEHVVALQGVAHLDVNEQNQQALGFYQLLGFQATGRSEVDGQGWPYPLLHLALAR